MNTVVITGATSGIGLETARLLSGKGYRIIAIGHTEENCKRARESIVAEQPKANIQFFWADLMQQREVLRLAEKIEEYLNKSCDGKLHALVNNAGCVRSWYMTTDEGYEQQFALNHLAGFLLTHRLLPFLRRANGRVMMTGSGSHKGVKVHWKDIMLCRGYNPLIAYKQSKLCNMLFAHGLNDRFASAGLRAYVVDPGLVHTDIGNKNTGGLLKLLWSFRKRFGAQPSVPAQTYAFLCEGEIAPRGLYYYLEKESPFSKQVTSENADRLFAISERLCGVRYRDGKEAPVA